ncbi:MAG: hypothetical protein Q8K98_06330 [Bacteroidota bacterium]|nr:hypothetical protein [Bacteroidota bacterium]
MKSYIKILASILLFCFSIITDAQAQFIKYEGNPVLRLGPAGSWESKQVSHPRILFDGKLFRMWYAGSNDTCRQIGYATSVDGINWTKHPANPVLKIGERSNFDGMVVSPGAVVFDGIGYHIYYTARSVANTEAVCHATSPDGITWTKDDANNPVLERGTTGWWDDYGVSAGPVLRQGTEWKMWYNGFRSDARWHAGIATSSDGVHWTKDTLNNPLFEQGVSGTWDEYEQWLADVLPDSSYYEAFYFGNAKQRAIGYAVSRDGIAWGKYEGNPILTPKHSTDDKAVLFQSSFLKTKDEYKIWYSDGMTAQICFALSAAFTPVSAQEQEKRMLVANKPVASAAKSESKQVAKIPVPDYTAELKDGILLIKNLQTANSENEYGDYKVDIKSLNEENKKDKNGGNWQLPESIPKNILAANVEGYDAVNYLVYEDMIVGLFKNKYGPVYGRPINAPDGSKIFTNSEAIYIAPDGSIVATTPTYALTETRTGRKASEYAGTFKGIPALTNPTITKGNGTGFADVSDPSLSSPIQVTIATGELAPKSAILGQLEGSR